MYSFKAINKVVVLSVFSLSLSSCHSSNNDDSLKASPTPTHESPTIVPFTAGPAGPSPTDIDCTSYLSAGGAESGRQTLHRLGIDPADARSLPALKALAKKEVLTQIIGHFNNGTQLNGFPKPIGLEALTTVMSLADLDLTNDVSYQLTIMNILPTDIHLPHDLAVRVGDEIRALPPFPTLDFLNLQPHGFKLNWQYLTFPPYRILAKSKYSIPSLPEVTRAEWAALKDQFRQIGGPLWITDHHGHGIRWMLTNADRTQDTPPSETPRYVDNLLNQTKKIAIQKQVKLAYCEATSRNDPTLVGLVVSIFSSDRCLDGTSYLAQDALTALGLAGGDSMNPSSIGEVIDRILLELLNRVVDEHSHLAADENQFRLNPLYRDDHGPMTQLEAQDLISERKTYVPEAIWNRLIVPLALHRTLTETVYPFYGMLGRDPHASTYGGNSNDYINHTPSAVLRRALAAPPAQYTVYADTGLAMNPLVRRPSQRITPDIVAQELDKAYRRSFVQGPRKEMSPGIKMTSDLVQQLMYTQGAEHMPYLQVLHGVYNSFFVVDMDIAHLVTVNGANYRVGDFITGEDADSPMDTGLTLLFWHYVLRYYGLEIPR